MTTFIEITAEAVIETDQSTTPPQVTTLSSGSAAAKTHEAAKQVVHGVRKVALDVGNKTAYLYVGRSLRPQVGTAEQYEALSKLVVKPRGGKKSPPGGDKGDETGKQDE